MPKTLLQDANYELFVRLPLDHGDEIDRMLTMGDGDQAVVLAHTAYGRFFAINRLRNVQELHHA